VKRAEPMRDLSEFSPFALRRWWIMAVEGVIAVLVLGGALAVFNRSSSATTTHLVLRPASSLPATQVPGAIDGLRPDGSLVQTVLHVLGSDRLLQTALATTKPNDPTRYAIKATVQPGSAFFDQEVTGPDAQAGHAIARSLNVADAEYIHRAYTAYSLDVVGADASTRDSFPPKPAVALLVLLLGVAFGLATVFADWWFLEPRRASGRAVPARLDDIEVPEGVAAVSERLAAREA
jgi:uncharacterized protein involved in exopolysaccharide biosynthesis